MESSDRVVISLSIDIPLKSKGDALFYYKHLDYSCADWMVFATVKEMFHGRISLIWTLYCCFQILLVQVNIDVYITHHKYQVKPHLYAFLSAAFSAAMSHRNHFFGLHQQNKFSLSKAKFRQSSNCCQGFLKLPNLVIIVLSPPRNLAHVTFSELIIVFSTMVNLLFILY